MFLGFDMKKISELATDGICRDLYKRSTGGLYIKINERLHSQAEISDDHKRWVCVNTGEVFDPDEQVEIVHWCVSFT